MRFSRLDQRVRALAQGLGAILAFVTPGVAQAHVLDVEAFAAFGPLVAGLGHPVLGPDHFLAMFSVGVVSAILGGRHYWLVPACFVCVMPLG